ncbi:MAG: toxin-antitoxin system YwqK family antitoxin [Chitinophagaceae bacterium]
MRAFLYCLVFSSFTASAQWKDFLLTKRGDTLNRVDLVGKKQGPWVVTVPELRGERGYEEEGYFVNDQKEGIWKKFSPEGVKIAEENYRWGKLQGKQLYFSFNGGLIREESWRAMDPANAYDTVVIYDLKDPDKMVGEVVVKNEGLSMRHGQFVYYDPRTGSVLQTEYYVMNKLQEEAEQKPIRDTIPRELPRVVQEFDKKKKRN